MKITILSGSAREGRQSHKAAYFLQRLLHQRGVNADLIDLGKQSLPILEERMGYHKNPPKEIEEISQQLQEADALIFVTPEYHGSFSGVLKNALDYFWSEFTKKPIGVVSASSGRFGGINASTQLQHVILSLGAYPLPRKLLVPEIHLVFNENNEPQSEAIVNSANKFLDEYLWFADAVYQKKSRRLEKAG